MPFPILVIYVAVALVAVIALLQLIRTSSKKETYIDAKTAELNQFSEKDEDFMRRAIELAMLAEEQGEVPVGAVLVKDDKIIAEGFNQSISSHDPSAHAEVVALRNAGQMLENYRLTDTTLYVTLEPCAMCAQSLVHARVKRLVFGASDPKTGACGSAISLLEHSSQNHLVDVSGGLLADQCGGILSDFFRKRRREKKQD